MQKTPNLGLEVGPYASDGGQEGAFKRNMQKIDAAFGGGGEPVDPLVNAVFNAGTNTLTFTKASGGTIDVDLSSLAGGA